LERKTHMKGREVEKVMVEEGMEKTTLNSLEFCWREMTILLLPM
jgi:hypothetical protein